MAIPRKAAKKAAKPRGKGKPFQKGADPRRNVTIPGSGRPPDEFKAMLAGLASRDETLTSLAVILNDPDHPAFQKALDYVTDRGYDKLAETVKVDGTLTVNVNRQIIPAPPASA